MTRSRNALILAAVLVAGRAPFFMSGREEVSGTLDLTRIDPPGPVGRGATFVKHPRIEGRFRMLARPAWSQ